MNASSYIPTISICRKRPWAIHGGAFLVAIVLVAIVADDRDRASHRNVSAILERVAGSTKWEPSSTASLAPPRSAARISSSEAYVHLAWPSTIVM